MWDVWLQAVHACLAADCVSCMMFQWHVLFSFACFGWLLSLLLAGLALLQADDVAVL